MGKFVIQRSRDMQYYFELKAGNGETILTSEMYRARQSVDTGIASVRANAPHDNKYDRLESSSGYRFNLKADNYQVIGTSEIYTTAQNRDKGIESVKINAPTASVDDQS